LREREKTKTHQAIADIRS